MHYRNRPARGRLKAVIPGSSVFQSILKLIFCVIAALFTVVTVISAQRRDAAATITLIAMEWA